MIELGPGMVSHRRCVDCGALLAGDDGERCADCRPQLSVTAEVVGALRRARDEEIAAMEREAELLALAIRKLEKRIRWRLNF